MTLSGFLAVGIGGALGCWSRWLLGIALNPLFSSMLLGTLAANLIGGFLIGVAIEYFVHQDSLPPELRSRVVAVMTSADWWRPTACIAAPRTR